MPNQTDDHRSNPDHTPGSSNAPLRAKKPWHAPFVIIANTLADADKNLYAHEGTSSGAPVGPS